MRFQLVMAQSEMEALEDWRGRQKPIPNKSEAIRKLFMQAIRESTPQSSDR